MRTQEDNEKTIKQEYLELKQKYLEVLEENDSLAKQIDYLHEQYKGYIKANEHFIEAGKFSNTDTIKQSEPKQKLSWIDTAIGAVVGFALTVFGLIIFK